MVTTPTPAGITPVKVVLTSHGKAGWRMTCPGPECVSTVFFLSTEKAARRMAAAHRRGHHFSGQVVEPVTPPGSIDWEIQPPAAPRSRG
jgi:hypothetical protein